MAGVVLGGAVGDLDEEPARPLDQQRQRVVGGDQVGVDAEPEQPEPVREVVLPDRLVPLEEPLAAPDVVDEDVEPPALGADAGDERRDLVRHQMVDAHRHPLAAEPRSTSAAVSSIVSRAAVARAPAAAAAAGHIDRRPGGAELDRDPAPGPAGGARDERHLPDKRAMHRLPSPSASQ